MDDEKSLRRGLERSHQPWALNKHDERYFAYEIYVSVYSVK